MLTGLAVPDLCMDLWRFTGPMAIQLIGPFSWAFVPTFRTRVD